MNSNLNGNIDTLDFSQHYEFLRSQFTKSEAAVKRLEVELEELHNSRDSELKRHTLEYGKLRDRYDRLIESHTRLSKLNHDLEEKLIDVVGQLHNDKVQLTEELRLSEAKRLQCESAMATLRDERDRYKNDCNSACQMLQANPDNFLGERRKTIAAQHSSTRPIPPASSATANTFPTFLPTFPPVPIMFSSQSHHIQPDASLASSPPTGTSDLGKLATTTTAHHPQLSHLHRDFTQLTALSVGAAMGDGGTAADVNEDHASTGLGGGPSSSASTNDTVTMATGLLRTDWPFQAPAFVHNELPQQSMSAMPRRVTASPTSAPAHTTIVMEL